MKSRPKSRRLGVDLHYILAMGGPVLFLVPLDTPWVTLDWLGYAKTESESTMGLSSIQSPAV